jgi:mono/diheme cytochrome c family protein
MKKNFNLKNRNRMPLRAVAVIGTLLSMIGVMAFGLNNKSESKAIKAPIKDSVASVKAFKQVYTVLMSARCMNCHPAGNIPLQGDDSHLHTMSPQRGADGKGVYAMKCSNCHQPTNTPGLHTPPGNPNWHLPPANMKMVFQGKTPRQLAKQIVDPAQNGHKNIQQLIEHADDGLVKAGWNPGEGRTLPPMSHAAFKKLWITWLKTGAYAPAK